MLYDVDIFSCIVSNYNTHVSIWFTSTTPPPRRTLYLSTTEADALPLHHRGGRSTTTSPRRTLYHYTTEVDVLPLHHRGGRSSTTPPRWTLYHYTTEVDALPLHHRGGLVQKTSSFYVFNYIYIYLFIHLLIQSIIQSFIYDFSTHSRVREPLIHSPVSTYTAVCIFSYCHLY